MCLWINCSKTFLFAVALCGVVMYNYIKVKDVRASQAPSDGIVERMAKVSFVIHIYYRGVPFWTGHNLPLSCI